MPELTALRRVEAVGSLGTHRAFPDDESRSKARAVLSRETIVALTGSKRVAVHLLSVGGGTLPICTAERTAASGKSTSVGAAVGVVCVSVVAGFTGLLPSVSADGKEAQVGTRVRVVGVSVIALFNLRNESVATDCSLAERSTVVSVVEISIVAFFG